MTPLQLQAIQLGVSVFVLVGGGAWCLAVAWPFMRDTRRAALRSLVISEKVALTLDEVLRAVRKVDFERVEKLLEAAEKWTKPKAPVGPLEPTMLTFSDGATLCAGMGDVRPPSDIVFQPHPLIEPAPRPPDASSSLRDNILDDGSVALPPPPTLDA